MTKEKSGEFGDPSNVSSDDEGDEEGGVFEIDNPRLNLVNKKAVQLELKNILALSDEEKEILFATAQSISIPKKISSHFVLTPLLETFERLLDDNDFDKALNDDFERQKGEVVKSALEDRENAVVAIAANRLRALNVSLSKISGGGKKGGSQNLN
ncbi:hypothetical protein KKC87_00450 [Patescibacteria group bacterium]|nr:hypothetical protein [Patescibacteria group bacterium]